MLLHDAVGQGQAEPEPPRLRGDEGVEDPIEQLGGNALALVGDLDLDQRPGPRAQIDAPPEHGVEGQPRGEREPSPARHGLDPVLDEVLEHLDEAVRVGPEGREARIVAPHELDLVGARRRLPEQGHAIEQLVEVHEPEGQGQRASEIQERLHHAIDAIDLGQHDASRAPGTGPHRPARPPAAGRRPGSRRAGCGSRARGPAPSAPAPRAARRVGPPPRAPGSATGRAAPRPRPGGPRSARGSAPSACSRGWCGPRSS